MNAKEEAIDEEKAGQESEPGLDQWLDYIPTLLCHQNIRLLWWLKRMKTRRKINVHCVKNVSIKMLVYKTLENSLQERRNL